MKARKKPQAQSFAAAVGRALRRAGVMARKTARMHGTPLYVWKDGKVVAENPDRGLPGRSRLAIARADFT